MKKFQWIFCLSAVLLTATLQSSAHACSCALPPPAKEALQNATAVFSGKVTATQQTGIQLKVTLQVVQVWKGDLSENVVVTTCSDGACCGYSFSKEESYLVYASQGANAAELHTNLCSRTKALKDASDDLKELGAGKPPKKADK